MAKVIFGTLGLMVGVLGIVMTMVPVIWRTSLTKMLREPGPRFLATQGMVLGGLVLLIGTNEFQGFWLWVTLGFFGVVVGCFMLGASSSSRERLIHLLGQWPSWLYRLGGVMVVCFAVLFGADLILHGS